MEERKEGAILENAANTEEKKGESKVKKEILEWIKLLAVVLAIGLPLRFFVFQPILVQQTSMLPTLHEGQYMATYKLGYLLGDAHRLDVVVCHFPNEKDYFVKRLIGLPGERVRVEDGVVYINGTPLDEPYVMPENRSHDTMGEIQLGDDEVFVMGDNRAVSRDSRSESVGPIKRNMLVGHAVAVMWPPAAWKTLSQPT